MNSILLMPFGWEPHTASQLSEASEPCSSVIRDTPVVQTYIIKLSFKDIYC